MLGWASAHMGISSPKPMDQAVGDPYRYPVVAGQSSANGGVCHGVTSGGDKLSGSATLQMSFGASHNGGPCGAYVCSDIPAQPFCQRLVLPDMQGCVRISETNDCTLKGDMDVNGITGGKYLIWIWTPVSSGSCEIYMNCWEIEGGTSQDTLPPTMATPAPTPALPPTPFPTSTTTGRACKSKVSYITDAWCQSVQCDPAYDDFCGYSTDPEPPTDTETTMQPTSAPTKMPTEYVGQECQLYQVRAGDTWVTIATTYDLPALIMYLYPSVDENDADSLAVSLLKIQNRDRLGEVLVEGMVLEIPGDCPDRGDVDIDGGDGDGQVEDNDSGASHVSMGLLGSALVGTLAILLA